MILRLFKEWYYGKLNKQVIAREAYDILQNEAFIIAKETVQNDILEEWGSTPLTDTEKREKLFMQYRAVEEVCEELAGLITSLDQSRDAKSDQGVENGG